MRKNFTAAKAGILATLIAGTVMLLLPNTDPQIFTSIKTGDWYTASTWLNGKIPTDNGDVIINPKHIVTLRSDAHIHKLTINDAGSLVFDKTKTVTLEQTGNTIILGKLQMRPSAASIVHTIRYVGVDESKFVGSTPGMMHDVPETDVGMWVMYNGLLDAVGTSKTAWTRLKDSATAGRNWFLISGSVSNWNPGDEICLAPTLPITSPNFFKAFDYVRVNRLSKDTVFTDSSLKYNHPATLNPWTKKFYTAEVMNLTRNVRIEGTPGGRSHINMTMLKGKVAHSYVAIRYMGPRQMDTTGWTKQVLGRYGDHLHMNEDATRGSVITGVVIRDCGSWGMVVHGSHGVTVSWTITLNTFDAGFTWDFPPQNGMDTVNNSNDIKYSNDIAALINCDPPFRGFRMPGFQMGSGRNNSCIGCVVVGNQSKNGNGFDWSEKENHMLFNVWIHKDNTSHNNAGDGEGGWQNDAHNHTIEGLISYKNGGKGIEDGAYRNCYKFKKCYLIDNETGIFVHAVPTPGVKDSFGYYKTYSDCKSNSPVILTRHLLSPTGPVLFYNCSLSSVIIAEDTTKSMGLHDFVNCNLKTTDFVIKTIAAGSVCRIQNANGTCFMIDDKKKITTIPKFFPLKK